MTSPFRFGDEFGDEFTQFIPDDGNSGVDSGNTGQAGGGTITNTGGNTTTGGGITTTTDGGGNNNCGNQDDFLGCVDNNGTARYSTGTANNFGECGTYQAYDLQCLTTPPPSTPTSNCPEYGSFLQCSSVNGLGIYAGGDAGPGKPCYTFTAPADECKTQIECPPVGEFIRCTGQQTSIGGIAEFSNGIQNGQCSSFTRVDEQCGPTDPPPPPSSPPPPPPSAEACPPYQEFLGCNGSTGTFAFGSRNQFGECETYSIPYAVQCYNPPVSPEACPPAGQFIQCNGTTGVYHAGSRDATGQCGTYTTPYDIIGGCAGGDPPSCPAEGTFKRCVGTTGYYESGVSNAQGQCTEYSQAYDAQCYDPPPPDPSPSRTPAPSSPACSPYGTFITCTANGTGIYSEGVKDASGECKTYQVSFDAQCTTCPQNGTFIQCEQSTGIYYTGVKNSDGTCATRPNPNDSNCVVQCPPANEFIQCVGSDAVYHTGTYNYNLQRCDTRTVPNDSQCYNPPSPSSTPAPTPPPSPPPQEDYCPPYGTFDGCAGDIGIYYQGTRVGGICEKYQIFNDERCYQPPPSPSNTPVPIFPTPSNTPVPIPPTPSNTPAPPPSNTPRPTPSNTPFPTPSPSPVRWRDCVDGILKDGNAPAAYREVNYSGAGGGMCWEPTGNVGFSPSLSEVLMFTYQRGSSELPQAKKITATNPSYGRSYSVTITTNSDIIITPSAFTIAPRKSVEFSVKVTPQLLEQLGDGSSTLQMSFDIMEL
jgi:hypothetical protein